MVRRKYETSIAGLIKEYEDPWTLSITVSLSKPEDGNVLILMEVEESSLYEHSLLWSYFYF